jgi:hypothetical protein
MRVYFFSVSDTIFGWVLWQRTCISSTFPPLGGPWRAPALARNFSPTPPPIASQWQNSDNNKRTRLLSEDELKALLGQAKGTSRSRQGADAKPNSAGANSAAPAAVGGESSHELGQLEELTALLLSGSAPGAPTPRLPAPQPLQLEGLTPPSPGRGLPEEQQQQAQQP